MEPETREVIPKRGRQEEDTSHRSRFYRLRWSHLGDWYHQALAVLLLICLAGCGPSYSARDRELYASDAEIFVKAFDDVELPPTAYREAWQYLRSREKRPDGSLSPADLAALVAMLPGMDTNKLETAVEDFRRKYTHTDLDKDFHLILRVQKVSESLQAAWLSHQVRILAKANAQESISEAETEESVQTFRQDMDELKSAIARVRSGHPD
ncbi:MAG: hypothetical protein AB7S38_28675 [Vulcanimicrobiota bacterium]